MSWVLRTLRYPALVTLLSLLLNIIGYGFIAATGLTVNEYSLTEYLWATLIYGLLVYLFFLFLRDKYIVIVFPMIYAFVSVFILIQGYLDGYDFVFLCNTAWSRCYFIAYTALTYPDMSQLADAALMIGLFFLYQVALLYVAQRINRSPSHQGTS